MNDESRRQRRLFVLGRWFNNTSVVAALSRDDEFIKPGDDSTPQ
jgi:hypothetical protein